MRQAELRDVSQGELVILNDELYKRGSYMFRTYDVYLHDVKTNAVVMVLDEETKVWVD